MASLTALAKSSNTMDITIQFDGKRYSFNLYKEVKIDLDRITYQIARQPGVYSFLTGLLKRVNSALEDAEIKRKRKFAQLYIRYKNGDGSRPPGDELVKAKIEVEVSYVKLTDEVMLLRRNKELLEGCVRSFEHRKDLLQTLSANLRKES